jgi:kumamolisin
MLRLTVALEPRDPNGLRALATDASTPGTPAYRHYLSLAQFSRRFGATASQTGAVQAALRARGLVVGPVTANGLTLPVTGTAAQVEQAFSTSILEVRTPGGSIDYANAQAPALPRSVAADVQAVTGLDDLALERPQNVEVAGHVLRAPASAPHVVTGGPQPCSAASAAAQHPGGYTADAVASAYQFAGLYGGGDQGAGQTVALVELEPYSPADIATYQSCYATGVPVSNVDVDGGPGAYTPGVSNDDEAALDIEQLIGLAPKASVVVYQAPDTGAAALAVMSQIVSDDSAKVVATSWGVCEAVAGTSQMSSENTLLQEAAAQGQSFFAASGDSGSAACYQSDHTKIGLSVADPSSQPFAIGVGATSLYSDGANGPTLYTPGQAALESVWNDGTDSTGQASATTGGISTRWGMPSYQSGAAASVGVVNAYSSGTPCVMTSVCRQTPDVSADGDPATPYVIFANGVWVGLGGTSAAAPVWAALTALVNASPVCRGVPVGFVNPALYGIAGVAYASSFHDVALPSPISHLANNDAIGANGGLYPVTAGYDMTTGLGSPVAPALANALCGGGPGYSVSVASPGAQSTVAGHGVLLHVEASVGGPAALIYAATGLPAGLSINPFTGVISGSPSVAGASSVTVSASDVYNDTGAAQFSWTIVNPPPPPRLRVGAPTDSRTSLKGLAGRRPALSFALRSGSNAPLLKSVVISLPSGLGFSKSSTSLSKGVVVRNGRRRIKVKTHVNHETLTISLLGSVSNATLTIAAPAISVSTRLAAKVRHDRVKQLTVVLLVTDQRNESTAFIERIKV